MVLNWLWDVITNTPSVAEQAIQSLCVRGIDAKLVEKKLIEVREGPIASIKVVDEGDNYSSDVRLKLLIPDLRLSPAHNKVQIRSKPKKSGPFLAKEIIGLDWEGNDLGFGIVDRLNDDDSLSFHENREPLSAPAPIASIKASERHVFQPATTSVPHWLDDLSGVSISVDSHGRGWVLDPNRKNVALWDRYEAIAQHLLTPPLVTNPSRNAGATIAQESIEPHEFQLAVPELTQVLATLQRRSWLFHYYLDRAGQKRCLERIVALQGLLSAIVDRLFQQGVLEPTAQLSSIYVIGSYPWLVDPADVDLFLIIEGEYDWTPLSVEELKGSDVRVPELQIEPALEIVGREKLSQAGHGEQVPNSERLVLRHTLLYGSVLLAGPDIFERSIGRDELNALRRDLLKDKKRANWPELKGDQTKIKAKKKWRQAEAKALREFRSHLPHRQRFLPWVFGRS